MSGGSAKNASAAPAGAEEGGDDPSMEDILASIRRILSEDETAAEPAAPEPEPAEAAAAAFDAPILDPDDEVLVLDESMMVLPPAPEAPVEAAAPPPAKLVPPVFAPPEPADGDGFAPSMSNGLIAGETEVAAAASVSNLMRSLNMERQMQVYRGGPTLEDMVLEAMRPMLKSWLDQNLPPMVERLVRIEIERVTTRALAG